MTDQYGQANVSINYDPSVGGSTTCYIWLSVTDTSRTDLHTVTPVADSTTSKSSGSTNAIRPVGGGGVAMPISGPVRIAPDPPPSQLPIPDHISQVANSKHLEYQLVGPKYGSLYSFMLRKVDSRGKAYTFGYAREDFPLSDYRPSTDASVVQDFGISTKEVWIRKPYKTWIWPTPGSDFIDYNGCDPGSVRDHGANCVVFTVGQQWYVGNTPTKTGEYTLNEHTLTYKQGDVVRVAPTVQP